MADIFHQFTIKATGQQVFQAVATPTGLDAWWTLSSSGQPAEGATWRLWFGPEYDWRATVTRCAPGSEFELELTDAMEDWVNTRVGFSLTEKEGVTTVRFYHIGWSEPSQHYCISSYCWAMYLRLLKRYVERGEITPYEARDEA
ncbi:MAG TPA: SRPBCC domain-containing protein [Blastocatellia bacterium]|nr:SRPBCC domain-containing protein [Blastocatellia bacterium]